MNYKIGLGLLSEKYTIRFQMLLFSPKIVLTLKNVVAVVIAQSRSDLGAYCYRFSANRFSVTPENTSKHIFKNSLSFKQLT